MHNRPSADPAQPPGGFASTHWSVVLLAGGNRAAAEVREALARLCSAYWYPLYAFIRRQGHSADDAEELTQTFFALFLEKDYLGTVDNRIAMPRHATPRVRVPSGSVGIAGIQTGVYPAETPGGWQLIGRTPVKPFDPFRDPPFLMKAGDSVQFYPIERREYDAWK